MSLHVLDTDILTLLQTGHSTVVQHASSYAPGQLALTIISVEEQLRGWYTHLRRAKKRDQLARVYQRMIDAVRFFGKLNILTFPEPAIARYEQLRSAHRNVGTNDLRIAAIVLEQDGTLVTRNVSDFQAIPGLKIKDWSK